MGSARRNDENRTAREGNISYYFKSLVTNIYFAFGCFACAMISLGSNSLTHSGD